MATPTPAPDLHIKSAARKLPIKRKSPLPSSDPDPIPNPNPNPNPNPITSPIPAAAAAPAPAAPAAADNVFYDKFPDEEEDADFADGGPASSGGGAAGEDAKPPPFKFHRIWSESDEIRFLQGLLGCFSQGMVFPRDLNLFYDRFSESMPQPFTRSQLSEKLRRLRRKYRSASARIDRGHDPARLAPHDRDLLHLCTRLWHPSHAASSPFSSSPDGANPPPGNKRRRANPRDPSALPVTPSTLPPPPALALPAPIPGPTPAAAPASSTFLIHASELVSFFREGNPAVTSHEEKRPVAFPPPPTPLPESHSGSGKDGTKQLLVKTVLDVFDGSLHELRMSLVSEGILQTEQQLGEPGSFGTDFAKRWHQQRLEELDVLARRLRLMLEDSLLS